MERREELIHAYIHAWLDRDVTTLDDVFTKNAQYSECYGPEYHGLA